MKSCQVKLLISMLTIFCLIIFNNCAKTLDPKHVDMKRIDIKKIPLGDAIIMGTINAKHRIIVFTDPECPFCKTLHFKLKNIVETRKDIAFYIILWPLEMHDYSYLKSKAVICENSPSLLDEAFQKQGVPMYPKCETPVIDRNIDLAKTIGLRGVPTLISWDGKVFVGNKGAQTLILKEFGIDILN